MLIKLGCRKKLVHAGHLTDLLRLCRQEKRVEKEKEFVWAFRAAYSVGGVVVEEHVESQELATGAGLGAAHTSHQYSGSFVAIATSNLKVSQSELPANTHHEDPTSSHAVDHARIVPYALPQDGYLRVHLRKRQSSCTRTVHIPALSSHLVPLSEYDANIKSIVRKIVCCLESTGRGFHCYCNKLLLYNRYVHDTRFHHKEKGDQVPSRFFITFCTTFWWCRLNESVLPKIVCCLQTSGRGFHHGNKLLLYKRYVHDTRFHHKEKGDQSPSRFFITFCTTFWCCRQN